MRLRHANKQFGDSFEERRGSNATSSRVLLIWVLLVLFCITQISLGQTNAAKTVLVLYDGGREFSSIQLTDQNIESILSGALSNRVTIFREYMDLTRIGPTNYEQVLRDFYRSKYPSTKPDVIVAIRSRTLDFLLKHGDELFPEVPHRVIWNGFTPSERPETSAQGHREFAPDKILADARTCPDAAT